MASMAAQSSALQGMEDEIIAGRREMQAGGYKAAIKAFRRVSALTVMSIGMNQLTLCSPTRASLLVFVQTIQQLPAKNHSTASWQTACSELLSSVLSLLPWAVSTKLPRPHAYVAKGR